MSVIVRKAREDELPGIAGLCREAYQELASNMTAEDRADQLARVSDVENRFREGTVFVAQNEDEVAGTVTYYRSGTHPFEHMDVGWAAISMLAVAQAHRGLGIGRLLVEHCVRGGFLR